MTPLKIIVGAGGDTQEGWISLEEGQLDITKFYQWAYLFTPASIDAILAEHVLEHLTPAESFEAALNFYYFLRSGGYARICVPDGLHPDGKYQQWVAPGTGWNGDDHKQLFDYRSMTALLMRAGFIVQLKEFWDEAGIMHSSLWAEDDGRIRRCSRTLYSALISLIVGAEYTSLLVDAVKP